MTCNICGEPNCVSSHDFERVGKGEVADLLAKLREPYEQTQSRRLGLEATAANLIELLTRSPEPTDPAGVSEMADELERCKTVDRALDARTAVALYDGGGHADPRDDTRARLPSKSDECAEGTYWIVAFSGLSLRTAPHFSSDPVLKRAAMLALRSSLRASSPVPEVAKEALAVYADQLCEHGTDNEGCGKFPDEICFGCRARAALQTINERSNNT